jgi:hypothetical protein
MRVLFLDPGKMTGWGILHCHDEPLSFLGGEASYETVLDYWGQPSFAYARPTIQATQESPGMRYQSKLLEHGINRVVAEGFDITPRTYQTNPNQDTLWAVKMLGPFELWCRWAGIAFEVQSRTAKNYDKAGDKLKRLGWWVPAEGVHGEAGHRRDAGRHAIKWGVDHRLIDPGVFL